MQVQATESVQKVWPAQAPPRSRLGWADWLQVGIAAVALAACCRGEGHPFRWLAAALILPVIRLLVAPPYRLAVGGWFRRLRGSLANVAASDVRIPWSATFVFAVVPSLLLFLSTDRCPDIGDTWPLLPTACSLTTAGSWTLDAYVAKAPAGYALAENDGLPYCTLRRPGGIYSSYPSGMVTFALPATATARLLGADLSDPKVHKHLEKWVASWVSALAVGLFFLTALRLARPLPALVATFLLATGSALFSTCGQNLWQHDGVILWSLLALVVEFRRGLRERTVGVVLQGLACGMLPACRLSSALFLVPFGLWVLRRSPRRAMLLVAVAALVYAPWAWFYGTTYGNLFGPSTDQMAGGNWSWDLANTLGDVLVSPSHGILVYQPWLLLGLGSCLLWRREASAPIGRETPPVGWSWFCLAVVGMQVVLIAGWRCWWGGNCWGSRLAAEAVPLAALLCVRPIAALWPLRAGRVFLAILAVLGFLLHATAMYGRADHWHNLVNVVEHPEMLRSWSHAPFLLPLRHGRGPLTP